MVISCYDSFMPLQNSSGSELLQREALEAKPLAEC